MALGIGLGIKMDTMKWDIMVLTKPFTERLITIRLLPSEMEITVCCLDAIACFMQQ
jgi:hypothetical protein